MGDFLPLLEAFAAFALTMVALTTAVSSILGILQRAVRARAAGLRRLLVYYFRNELKPYLHPAVGNTNPAAKWAALETDLPQFLVDMSLQPATEATRPDGSDPRVEAVKRAEGSGTWLRRWQSLANAVDGLSPDEFLTRLKASRIYARLVSVTDPAKLDATLAELRDRFVAHGRAETERFARNSRIGTIILGFVLAYGLNIDAFTLLGRYMSKPEITQSILQQEDAILAKANGQAPAADGTAAPSAAETKLDQASATLNQAADLIKNLGTAAKQSDIDAIKEQASAVHEAAQDVAAEVNAAADAIKTTSETAAALRGTLTDLTQSFPIGWTLYPACTADTSDPKCVTLLQRVASRHAAQLAAMTEAERAAAQEAARAAAAKQDAERQAAAKAGKAYSPPCDVTAPTAPDGVLCAVLWTYENDTAGWFKWFGGALILGLMLGLGTPFWIEVVNNFLRARDLIANTRPKAKSGAGGAATPAATVVVNPPAPAPTAGGNGGTRKVF